MPNNPSGLPFLPRTERAHPHHNNHPSSTAMWEGIREATAKDRSADLDAQQLRALAGDYLPELAPGINNPEAHRESRM